LVDDVSYLIRGDCGGVQRLAHFPLAYFYFPFVKHHGKDGHAMDVLTASFLVAVIVIAAK
jgi:hypothetical protein